jgi:cathepsin X
MKKIFVFLFLFCTLYAASSNYSKWYGGFIQNKNVKPVIKTPLPQLSPEEFPTNFWWGNVSGVNYHTIQRNQHIPIYCGACWAFSATSAMSDRIKIMRKAQWPDILISPQVLLSCDDGDGGCHGGDSSIAYEWIHKNNITDETCSPYQALGYSTGLPCSSEVKCKNCAP